MICSRSWRDAKYIAFFHGWQFCRCGFIDGPKCDCLALIQCVARLKTFVLKIHLLHNRTMALQCHPVRLRVRQCVSNFKTKQLVSDATLKRTIQASMCLSIAGVLQVCTYQLDSLCRPRLEVTPTWLILCHLACGSNLWIMVCTLHHRNRNSLQTMQLHMQVTAEVTTQISPD